MLSVIEKDDELRAKLLELDELMNYFQEKFRNFSKDQQECDKMINDLYHDIELSDLSGAELMRDVVMLRDALRRRRIAKECGPIAGGLIPRLQAVKNLVDRIMTIQYHYNPRILRGLKYGDKKEKITA
jgi:hypothetical protein